MVVLLVVIPVTAAYVIPATYVTITVLYHT